MGKLEQARNVSALLLISLLLAACSGQGFPEPIPVASTVEVLPHLDTVVVIRFNTDAPGFENQAGAAADELISKILETRTDTGSR